MDGEQISKKLKTEFSDLEITVQKEFRIDIAIGVEQILDIARFLKHELGFTIPNMCTGTDLKDKLEVVWHIGTEDGPELIALRTTTDRETSEVPSLTNVWIGMNWHERETYDLLGIVFKDHPDLRRILMPENWEGHPLREDYVYKKPTYRKPEDLE